MSAQWRYYALKQGDAQCRGVQEFVALEEFLWNGRIRFVVKVLAVFLTEAWRIMALLSEKLRDRIRNQGRAAGLSEASSDWRKWLDRYEEARRKGDPLSTSLLLTGDRHRCRGAVSSPAVGSSPPYRSRHPQSQAG